MGFLLSLQMCYINSMLDKNIKPIDQYQSPSMVMRIAGAALDLALYILISFLILTLGGLIAGKDGSAFANANSTISEQIKYSKLAKEDEKNGYVAYTGNELLSLNDKNESLVITNVSYFYCSYLTGLNVENGLKASIDVNEQIKADNGYYLAKDYYTVEYFNQKILNLPKKDEISHSDYFEYQKNGEENDYTKVGVIKPEFIEDINTDSGTIKRLKNDTELTKTLNTIYNDAIKVFYNQKSIKNANKTIRVTNTVLMLISTLPTFAVIYLLFPLISPFGQTLGKRLLSMGVTDDKGYLAKKWRIALRALPILAVTIYICFVNSLYYQLLVALLLLLISMGIFVFTTRRRALHDVMAGTTVIKLEKHMVIYEDEEHYERALEIMKERDEQHVQG